MKYWWSRHPGAVGLQPPAGIAVPQAAVLSGTDPSARAGGRMAEKFAFKSA
jgi:hypothetical protein